MGNLVNESPKDNKDERLKHLLAEVDAMRTQMLGKMALIQGLAREQEELRNIVNQLHQDSMKQTVKARDQTGNQPPRRQEFGMVKNGPLQVATISQVQQPPHQKQRVYQSKPYTPKRQFAELNMPLSQALQHLLRLNLVTLRDPPQNPYITSPRYNPDAGA